MSWRYLTAKIGSLLQKKKYIANDLLPHTMSCSVLHPARQTQRSKRLGLAHQGHNGAGGGILDLSYSWGTMSTTGTNSEHLMQSAPQITRVCVRENVRTCTFSTGHKDFSAWLAVSQIIITQIWFGSRVFWLQFPLLKQSDTHPVLCSASGPHSIYWLKGNLKGDAGDA